MKYAKERTTEGFLALAREELAREEGEASFQDGRLSGVTNYHPDSPLQGRGEGVSPSRLRDRDEALLRAACWKRAIELAKAGKLEAAEVAIPQDWQQRLQDELSYREKVVAQEAPALQELREGLIPHLLSELEAAGQHPGEVTEELRCRAKVCASWNRHKAHKVGGDDALVLWTALDSALNGEVSAKGRLDRALHLLKRGGLIAAD
jgi:hypothetical protein